MPCAANFPERGGGFLSRRWAMHFAQDEVHQEALPRLFRRRSHRQRRTGRIDPLCLTHVESRRLPIKHPLMHRGAVLADVRTLRQDHRSIIGTQAKRFLRILWVGEKYRALSIQKVSECVEPNGFISPGSGSRNPFREVEAARATHLDAGLLAALQYTYALRGGRGEFFYGSVRHSFFRLARHAAALCLASTCYARKVKRVTQNVGVETSRSRSSPSAEVASSAPSSQHAPANRWETPTQTLSERPLVIRSPACLPVNSPSGSQCGDISSSSDTPERRATWKAHWRDSDSTLLSSGELPVGEW